MSAHQVRRGQPTQLSPCVLEYNHYGPKPRKKTHDATVVNRYKVRDYPFQDTELHGAKSSDSGIELPDWCGIQFQCTHFHCHRPLYEIE